MTLKHQFRLCIFCNYLYSYNKIGLHLYLRVNTPSKDWSGGIPRATMPPPYCWTSPHSAVVPITFSFGVRSRRGNDWTGRRGIHVNQGKVVKQHWEDRGGREREGEREGEREERNIRPRKKNRVKLRETIENEPKMFFYASNSKK